MRILVLGGHGHLGRRAVDTLRGRGGVEVEVASRRSGLDLEDPTTYGRVAGVDVVLDLADTTRARPDALAAHCLSTGVTFVEGSSDPETVRRLLALDDRDAKGAVVVGAGIFTGLSNLLVRAAREDLGGAPDAVELAISSSPYSGAGGGTVALMVAMLGRRAVRWVGGLRVEGPLERGPVVGFPDGRASRARPTLRAPFAEQEMLARSTSARDVDVLFAPRPGILAAAFLALPAWLLRTRIFAGVLTVYFTVLRRLVLRAVASRVELVARVAKGPHTCVRWLTAADGMAAGGMAAAAIAHALAQHRPPPGVRCVDEVLALDDVLAGLEGRGTVIAHGQD